MAERRPEPERDGQPDDPEPAGGSVGATRGVGDDDDPERAARGPRSGGSTEYTANAEPEDEMAEPTPRESVDPDPHDPPGEG